jgi:hypothetical protein
LKYILRAASRTTKLRIMITPCLIVDLEVFIFVVRFPGVSTP